MRAIIKNEIAHLVFSAAETARHSVVGFEDLMDYHTGESSAPRPCPQHKYNQKNKNLKANVRS